MSEAPSYPRFTPEMKKTHKILIPNMAPVQFRLMAAIMEQDGYQCELLENCGSQVAELGLKYVHNDTCYPALLVIGQFIDALNSGKYDLDHTALIITQTGGGCRASNYIHLLRKALHKAGYGNIPVVSLNFSGLERDSGFPMTLTLIRKLFAVLFYGDLLVTLRAQTEPYEVHTGEAAEIQEKWIEQLRSELLDNRAWRHTRAARDHAAHVRGLRCCPHGADTEGKSRRRRRDIREVLAPREQRPREVLASQDCEVNVPGIMGFVQYCVYNFSNTARLYGGNVFTKNASGLLLGIIGGIEDVMIESLKSCGFHAPLPFRKLVRLADGVISTGDKMGEGWLLTAEMVELVRSGYENIICAQPFGCLPNHICGKGVINRIRSLYPEANITPIDYDPGATRVNQENRIKLMLAVARERLEERERVAVIEEMPRREGRSAGAAS